MCYQNFSQNTGCGHYGPTPVDTYTLCALAQQALQELRGPMSPPLSALPTMSVLKRSTTSGNPVRRFFSASLNRSSTSASMASNSSRRTVSGPPGDPNASRFSTSSFTTQEVDVTPGVNIAENELKAVLCKGEELDRRTRVVSGGQMRICKRCKESINDMRAMIERYEKTGSVKGTKAFSEFLQLRGDAVGGKEMYG